MDIKYYFANHRKILSALIILALGITCLIVSIRLLKILDEKVPLNQINTEAMFYVLNSSSNDMTCIGDGIINTPTEIFNDESSVSKVIVSSPDYMNYLPAGTRIAWKTIRHIGDEYRVIGSLSTDEIPTSISLADYGAIGDGITDNYKIVQKAINDAIAKNQPLDVPSGTFYLSKKLVIPSSVTIRGTGPSSSIVIFKDITESSDYKPFLQRGLVAIKGNNINIENVAFKYEANNDTKYTREMFKTGTEGVLVVVFDSSDVHFTNCTFEVSGSLNPSVTCLWAKSESTGITNLSFDNCVFNSQTEAGVGGGVWISAYDNKDSVLNQIDITNCKFYKKGHDEPLALWGFNMSNVNISNNEFEYSSNASYMQTMLAIGSLQNTNKLTNCKLTGNKFKLNDNVATCIGIRNLSADSSVDITGNIINGNISSTRTFDCFSLSNCGRIFLSGNEVNVVGGSTTAYMTYDKGGIVHCTNDTASYINCKCWLLVKSTQSTNFTNGELYFDGGKFTIASSNTTAGISTVQFPLSSKLQITGVNIDTSASKSHEIVFQTLDSTYFSTSNNDLTLQNFTTDAEIFYNISNQHNRKITLNDVVAKNIYFSFFNKGTLEQVDINSCTYSNLYFNYKKVKPNTSSNFVKSLSIN